MSRKDNDPNVIDLCSSDDDIEPAVPNNSSLHSSSSSSSPHLSSSSGKHKRKTLDESAAAQAKHTARAKQDGNDSHSPKIAPLFIFINSEDGGDSCIVTESVMHLLQESHFSNAITCLAGCECDRLTFLHVQQKDRFSCGYRNMQMLLTAMLPLLPIDHSYYRLPPCSLYTLDAGHIIIPNLNQLQQFMEQAWAAGFDPKGAKFYNHKIVGKKSQIGAVEVSYTLLYLGIDCCVVQFALCPKSRSQLGPFCAAYFSMQFCPACTQRSEVNGSGSYETANHILQNLSSRCGGSSDPLCRCLSFPLFLQYEGHSVTVIGVEKFAHSDRVENLLLFDPDVSGSKLTKALSQNDIQPFRRSLSSLQARDCQIVLVSTKSLSASQQEQLKRGNGHILDAIR